MVIFNHSSTKTKVSRILYFTCVFLRATAVPPGTAKAKGAGSGMAGMAAAIPIQNLVWRRHTNQN